MAVSPVPGSRRTSSAAPVIPSAAASASCGAQLLGEAVEPEDGGCAVLLGDRDHEGVDGEAGRVVGGQRDGHASMIGTDAAGPVGAVALRRYGGAP